MLRCHALIMELKKHDKRKFYSEEELGDIASSLEFATTIPVNIEIEAEQRVFDVAEVEAMLRSSKYIFLNDCGCRTRHNNCNNPLDTCLAINVSLDYPEKGEGVNSRRITVEEALDVLRRSHEAGLVHMAYVGKGEEKPQLICSCCTCCCHTLGGLLHYGISTQVLTSKLIAEDETQKCISCGKCVERCVFGARTMVDGKLIYDTSRCFGCGLCISRCPTNAIKLVKRR
jgi:Pyruvate/2-oxoacid:ferredoxin oxidoreductase delta subunit